MGGRRGSDGGCSRTGGSGEAPSLRAPQPLPSGPRVARSAVVVHRQPGPLMARRGVPFGEGCGRRRDCVPRPSALEGTKAATACDAPDAGGLSLPIDRGRPSDRRGPGMDPGPQDAFKVSMINVSCKSHYFSQLAAFFIDARAE